MNPEEGLVSGGADGTLAVWYPSPQAEKLGLSNAQELDPSATGKAHEGEILSLAVQRAQKLGPEEASLLVISSGKISSGTYYTFA